MERMEVYSKRVWQRVPEADALRWDDSEHVWPDAMQSKRQVHASPI
jgi:hypothetical protein